MTERIAGDTTSARRSIGQILRRQWIIILCAVVTVPTVAVLYALSQDNVYTATASLLFRDSQLDQKLFGSSFLSSSKDPNREATTNVKLASLDVVAERVAKRLGVGTTPTEIRRATTVASDGQSDVATVTAEDGQPRRAARIANVMVAEFVAYRREADQSKVREAQLLVARELARMTPTERATPRGVSLESRSEQLLILTSLQTGNVEVAEAAAVPSSPSSPRPIRSGAAGLFAGLLLAVFAALARERTDRRLRDSAELVATFERPLLASVFSSVRLEAVGDESTRLAEAEPFRILRASLRYFAADKARRTIVVVSAQSGDGKTTTAWHLAVASAQAGTSTLLLEADLRRPGLTLRMGTDATGPGLSDVLTQGSTFTEAVKSIQVTEGSRVAEARHVDVLLAGPLPPDPIDLLDSEAMQSLLSRARDQYDLVVVDTPPITLVADAIPLLAAADGVIVVARVGATLRPALRALQSQLESLEAHVLGVVANGVKANSGYYGGSNYYTDSAPRTTGSLPQPDKPPVSEDVGNLATS